MKNKQIITVVITLILGVLIGKYIFKGDVSSIKTTTATKVEHWTCSMHPEINLPEFGDCPKCGMDLIPATTSDDGLAANQFKMTKNAMALANIQTFVVGGETANKSNGNFLKLSGKIQTNGKTSAMQTAHFGGRLERLYFKTKGEYVKRGSLIASVYSPELVTAQNELLEAMKIKELQPELYKAVRNKLKNWKISEKQIQHIERTKKVMTNFNMYANVSGTIDTIFAQEGNHIVEGGPIFMISNLSSVWAVFDVYEQDVKHLKIGQELSVNFNAYPNEEVAVKVDFIDPILNSKTRTIAVRATLKSKNNHLKPGMLQSSFVYIKDTLGEKTVHVVIPKTAVLWTGKRSVVYVKPNKNESIFELRNVELGTSIGGNYQIQKGLEKGEEVVVNGIFTIDAVAQLQGKSSMMNQELEEDVKEIKVNTKFKNQLSDVFAAYINLKDAYVLTDAQKVSKHAKIMLANLQKVKKQELKTPSAYQIWMDASEKMKSNLKDIQQEKDIEKQRSVFILVSNTMQKVIEKFNINQKIYVQFCPMANDNTGAFWLSIEEKIRNPYFGDKMLHCGSVEKVLNSENNTATVYQCPMDCEHGKTYDKPGSCPICKMDLKPLDLDHGTIPQ